MSVVRPLFVIDVPTLLVLCVLFIGGTTSQSRRNGCSYWSLGKWEVKGQTTKGTEASEVSHLLHGFSWFLLLLTTSVSRRWDTEIAKKIGDYWIILTWPFFGKLLESTFRWYHWIFDSTIWISGGCIFWIFLKKLCPRRVKRAKPVLYKM
jgi:hypothetical protein